MEEGGTPPVNVAALKKAWIDASLEVVRLTTEQSRLRNILGRINKQAGLLRATERIVTLDQQILVAEAAQQLAWGAYRDAAGLRELARKAREITG